MSVQSVLIAQVEVDHALLVTHCALLVRDQPQTARAATQEPVFIHQLTIVELAQAVSITTERPASHARTLAESVKTCLCSAWPASQILFSSLQINLAFAPQNILSTKQSHSPVSHAQTPAIHASM